MARRATEEEKEEMRRLRAKGLSYAAIGQEVGLSESGVRLHIVPGERDKAVEWQEQHIKKHPGKGKRLSKAEIARIKNMRQRGMSFRAIAADIGCSTGTVLRWSRPESRANANRLSAEYDATHREELREYGRDRYWENPQLYRDASAEWASANREKVRRDARQYAADHRQERRDYGRAYYWRDPERHRRERREYQKTEAGRRSSANNSAKRHARLVAGRGVTHDAFERMWTEQEGRCPYCKALMIRDDPKRRYDPRYCNVEHKIPLSRGGVHGEENVELACRKCNLHKKDKAPEEFQQYRLAQETPCPQPT